MSTKKKKKNSNPQKQQNINTAKTAETANQNTSETAEEKSGGLSVFVFFGLMLAVICILVALSDTLDSSVLKKSYEMNSISFCSVGQDDRKYVIADGGVSVIVNDSDMNYLFKIKGGNVDAGFNYALEVASDEDYIYIRDYVAPETGNGYDEGSRIARFSHDGKFMDYIYTNQEADIYSMKSEETGLYFALMSDYYAGICHISPDGDVISEDYTDIPFEFIDIADVAESVADGNEKICLVLRTGDVYEISGGELNMVYDASEIETEQYFSLPYEADYDSRGNLYINDYGCRKIIKFENDTPETVIDALDYTDSDIVRLSMLPLFNGMKIFADDYMSFVITEYYYDAFLEDYNYTYDIVIIEGNGDTVYKGWEAAKKPSRIIKTVCAFICIAILAVMLFIMIKKALALIKNSHLQDNQKLNIVIILTASTVTTFVAAVIFSNYNTRYINEVMNKMSNICMIFSQNLNYEDIDALDSPDSYRSEAYNNIQDAVEQVIYDDINADTGLYCVIYKVIDGIVTEVYSGTDYHGGFYPMAGGYENSTEQSIYDTGEPYISYSSSSSAGSYMLALYPIYNNEGDVTALLETGTDLYAFSSQNNELLKNLIVYVCIAIITILLIINEIVNSSESFKLSKKNLLDNVRISPSMIRPVVFLVFFAANISTAFLPIYGTQLWTEDFPFQSEVAAALPLSAETLFAALTAFAVGFIADRIAPKILCCSSLIFYFAGNVMSAYAQNLYVLTLAGCCAGIAGGIFAISVNTYIASYTDEETRGKGFVSYNAAFIAGVHCGTVVGSVLAEKFGYFIPYISAAIILMPTLFFILKTMDNSKGILENTPKEKEKISLPRFIFSPRIICYFLLIIFPYVICASFLTYFFPIFGEESGLSESHISFAFLVSGVISIYLGPALSGLAAKKMGMTKSMIFASFIYAAALAFFIIKPSILGCFIVVSLFAVADGIGLTAQSVYYTGLPEVKLLGSGKAMSIQTTIENISSTCGPIIFGFVLMFGIRTGVIVLGITFAAFLLIFVFSNAIFSGKNKKSASEKEAVK